MSRRSRVSGALALVLVGGAFGMAGCASDQEKYCKVVAEHQEDLGRTSAEGGPAAVIEQLPVFRDLAGEAPSDIKDEWQVLINAVEGLQKAFAAADVDPEGYRPKNPPDGVTEAEQRRIERAAAALGSDRVTNAAAGIEQHALDICQSPIGL